MPGLARVSSASLRCALLVAVISGCVSEPAVDSGGSLVSEEGRAAGGSGLMKLTGHPAYDAFPARRPQARFGFTVSSSAKMVWLAFEKWR